ncbi:MAG: hypothetical protein ACYDBV_13460 [Nitrospiria bacterium]
MNYLEFKISEIAFLLLILPGCGNTGADSSSSTGPVISIAVTPNPATITSSSGTQQFRAIATDVNSQIVSGVAFNWSDTGTNSCIDQTGLARPLPGAISGMTDTIIAQSGSVSGTVSLTLSISGNPPSPPSNCQ